jgi:hypothetical protein
MILTLDNGTNQEFKIPAGRKFVVDVPGMSLAQHIQVAVSFARRHRDVDLLSSDCLERNPRMMQLFSKETPAKCWRLLPCLAVVSQLISAAYRLSEGSVGVGS